MKLAAGNLARPTDPSPPRTGPPWPLRRRRRASRRRAAPCAAAAAPGLAGRACPPLAHRPGSDAGPGGRPGRPSRGAARGEHLKRGKGRFSRPQPGSHVPSCVTARAPRSASGGPHRDGHSPARPRRPASRAPRFPRGPVCPVAATARAARVGAGPRPPETELLWARTGRRRPSRLPSRLRHAPGCARAHGTPSLVPLCPPKRPWAQPVSETTFTGCSVSSEERNGRSVINKSKKSRGEERFQVIKCRQKRNLKEAASGVLWGAVRRGGGTSALDSDAWGSASPRPGAS